MRGSLRGCRISVRYVVSTGSSNGSQEEKSTPKTPRSYMTVVVTLHNEYEWDDNFTLERVREAIAGYNCSSECEGISFVVDDIREEPPF